MRQRTPACHPADAGWVGQAEKKIKDLWVIGDMKVDGIVKSIKYCHSERGTSEESLKTNAPVQPDSSSQAPQNDTYPPASSEGGRAGNHFFRSHQSFYKKFCDLAGE